MNDRVLPGAVAEALSDSDDGDVRDGWRRVCEQEGDEGRWLRHMRLILSPADAPGELYALDFALGLTELPWTGDAESPMPVYRVEAREKVIVEYLRPSEPAFVSGNARIDDLLSDPELAAEVAAAEADTDEADEFEDDMIVRAKWTIEGAATLAEAAQKS